MVDMKCQFLILAVHLGALLACQSPDGNHTADSGAIPDVVDTADTLSAPERVDILFGDSSNRALFWDRESVVASGGDMLRIDGLTMMYISKAVLPIHIQTSLMRIDVLELPLLVQVDAFDKQAGQSLEVFAGALKVGKNYESPFQEVDTLTGGSLYMINKDIDLSEKEQLDDLTPLQWWKEVYSKEFSNAIADN